jgi:hypothetical protein
VGTSVADVGTEYVAAARLKEAPPDVGAELRSNRRIGAAACAPFADQLTEHVVPGRHRVLIAEQRIAFGESGTQIGAVHGLRRGPAPVGDTFRVAGAASQNKRQRTSGDPT